MLGFASCTRTLINLAGSTLRPLLLDCHLSHRPTWSEAYRAGRGRDTNGTGGRRAANHCARWRRHVYDTAVAERPAAGAFQAAEPHVECQEWGALCESASNGDPTLIPHTGSPATIFFLLISSMLTAQF